MKSALYLLTSFLLSMSLTTYGPLAMVWMGGDDAAFSMEICADGVAKIVHFDAAGNPVEPAQDCFKCLVCCHATGLPPHKSCDANPSFTLLEIEVDRISVQNVGLRQQNIRPMPRGPPVVHRLVLTVTDQAISGLEKHIGERPLSKDANS